MMSFEWDLFMAEDCIPASSTLIASTAILTLNQINIGKVIYNQLTTFKDAGFATLRSKLHLID